MQQCNNTLIGMKPVILGWKRQQKQPRPDLEVQPNIEVRFQKSRCAPYIRLLLYLPLTLRCLWRLHINWHPAWHMQRIIIHNNERHITYTYCKYSSNALLNWSRRFNFRVYWIIFSAPPTRVVKSYKKAQIMVMGVLCGQSEWYW